MNRIITDEQFKALQQLARRADQVGLIGSSEALSILDGLREADEKPATAKERVLLAYAEAEVVPMKMPGRFAVYTGPYDVIPLGRGNSEVEAWIDAATRLSNEME